MKGQIKVVFGIMLGLTIIILGLALSPALSETTTNSMNDSVGDTIGMNCSTTTDNFVRAGCIVTDLSPFWFLGGLILIGGGFAIAKIIF